MFTCIFCTKFLRGVIMAMTDAQRRANRKYDKAHYKTIACKCKLEDYEIYKNYAESQEIGTMSNLLNKCVKYCIENNIELKN